MRVKGVSGYLLMPLGRIIHLPLLLFLRVLGFRRFSEVSRGGLRYRLDLHEAIDLSIFLIGKLEPDVSAALDRLVKPGDHLLDIGANVGAHTLPMARRVGSGGRVYAFEPTDYAFGKLSRNLSLNPELDGRVTPFQIGLTDEKGTRLPPVVSSSWDLTRNPRESNPLDLGFGHSTGQAKVMSLDHFVRANQVERLDGIKIDVDGFEIKVLEGAAETLRRFNPWILMEWAPHHFVHPEEPFERLLRILRSAQFKFFDLGGTPIDLSPEEIKRKIPRGVLFHALASRQG